jgi:hypothetical protein
MDLHLALLLRQEPHHKRIPHEFLVVQKLLVELIVVVVELLEVDNVLLVVVELQKYEPRKLVEQSQ